MKKFNSKLQKLMLLAVLFFAGSPAFAQLAMTRSVFNGTYTPITGGTTSTATGDDFYQQNIPAGFSFNYLGTLYTQFSVSTNGWLSFANGATSDGYSPDLYSTTTNGVVAPWWDDLSTSAIVYQTTGSPGSMVCTIQWTSLSYYLTSTRTINYQVKLYEGTNVIEFWYAAAPTGTLSTEESACIGLKSTTGGNGQYLDAVTGSAFTGNTTLQSDRWPAYNFRFTPGAPAVIPAGTYNVGIGQTYRNLNEAAADVNHRGVSGAVTFNLVDAQYDVSAANGSNFFPVLIGPVAGTSAANTVTFTKSGTAAIVAYGGATGSNGSIANQSSITILSSNTDPVVGLFGADYVTINNFDIRGNVGNAVSEHGVGIYNSSATNGSTNNTISNIAVTMNRANTASRGFYSNVVTTPTSAAGANSNNTFKDFSIRSVYAGIQLLANATFPDLNTQVTRTTCGTFNTIGDPATANDIGNGTSQTYGILATNQSGFTISNNSIRNVSGSAAQTDGIVVVTFQGVSTISNNKIQTIRNISTTSTTGIAGIRMSHTTTGTHTMRVFNNSVSEITSAHTGAASTSRTLKGIFVNGTGGSTSQTYEITNNSVSINGSSSLNLSSTCFEVNTTSGPVYMVNNNIFANLTAAQGATSKHFTFNSTSATVTGNTGSISNFNNLYIANDAGVSGFIGQGNTTTYTTLANWQAAMTQDAASQSIDPIFVNSVSDLNTGALPLNNAGTAPQVYNTTDLNCAARTDNDMGAYIVNPCSGMPTAGSITGVTAVCSGLGTTLTLAGASSDAGISYQWASSLTNGGPYTTLLGTSITQATGPLTATRYYVVAIGCSVSGMAATTAQYTVAVNPLPVVAVTPGTGIVCIPNGSPVALTASGATTYNWLPVAGLTPSTGANVLASPTAPTTYTVTGTDGNGCINTATTVISLTEKPSLSALSATPSTICSGGNSQLLALAGLTSAYTVSPITYATVPTPGVGVTTLANAGVTVTPLSSGSLDDGGWQNRVIPFNFMYFGVNYTSFAVSTNGFIFLGTGAPATFTGYSNAFPGTAAARPAIGAMYSDLDFRTTGTINYFASGTAPNRMLVINWSGGDFYSGTGNLITQLIIYETTNVIEVHTTSSTGNNAAVEGIQNAAGTTAFTVTGRNNVTWAVSTPDAYRWSPSGGTLTYNWSPATFLGSTTISNPMANAVTATTTYTVTASNGVCSTTGSVTLTAAAAPTATASASPSATVCVNENVTFSVTPAGGIGPYTYTWSGPNAFSATGQNPTIAGITAAGNGTYTVAVTDNCSNTTTVTVMLTVNNLPVVALSGNTSVCTGDSTLLTGSSGGTSQWYRDGAAIPGATANTYMASAAGVYNMTKTNLNGCADSAATGITFVVNALPVVAANASLTTVCSGDNVTFTGSGATSYTWNSGVTDAVPFAVTAAGYYTVTGTDGNGCSALDSIMVNVNALPVVAANASLTSVCPGDNVTFTGSGTISYTWNNGVTDAVPFAVITSGYYTVTGTDGNGCSALDSIMVSVNALPVVALGADITQCGGPVTLDAGNAGSTYLWIDSTTTQTLAATATGMYGVTVTDSNGCSAADSINVTINALLVVALGADITVCSGGSIILDAGNAGSTYLWTDNTTAQTMNTTTSGLYYVQVTDTNGCSSSDTINVTFNSGPVVALGADTTVCGGSLVLDAGNPGSLYVWNTSGFGQTETVTVSGTYAVLVTDTNGCTGNDTILVVINTPPAVTFNLSQTTICLDDAAITLTATPSGGTFSGPGVTGSTFSPATLNGSQTLHYTYTDGNGCTVTASSVIVVNPCTGIINPNTTVAVNIYPNPNMGMFTIDLGQIPASAVLVEITNSLGQLVQKFMMTETVKQVDLSTSEGGVYYVRLTDGSSTSNYRVVKQ